MAYRILSQMKARLAWVLPLSGIAMITFVVAAIPVPRLESQAPQTASSLQLAVVEKSGSRFIVKLQNLSAQPLILNLGVMLANGREQYADRVRLQLTRP